MSGQLTTNAPVLQMLAQHLQRPVDMRTLDRAAEHAMDWLAVSALGSKQPAATGFIAAASDAAKGNHRTLGHETADSRGWWDALQVNAACGNMLEMDDLDRASILHPGPVIVPAAAAMAEYVGADCIQLLTALVRGYEATIRIGRALGTGHYAFFHNTSTCGAFGAAAAAASLLKLNVEQTVWALANAGSRTGGFWQMRHEACETKSLHNVMAAQTGVQAALLAAKGVRGPATLLEGAQGLFAAMAPGTTAQDVIADLDRDWLMYEVSFKPWPACRHAHPTIDATLAVIEEDFELSDIQSVHVETYQSALDFCDKPNPVTELEAKFSLQHCVAICLLEGAPVLADFRETDLQSTDVVAYRQRVSVAEDAQLTAAFPKHYGARVTVTLRGGRKLMHLQKDAKGDPELPLSIEEIRDKALLLLDEAGYAESNRLVAATLDLRRMPSLLHWTSLWP